MNTLKQNKIESIHSHIESPCRLSSARCVALRWLRCVVVVVVALVA